MSPRQSVLMAMFLSLTIYLLARASLSSLESKVTNLQPTPAKVQAA